MSLHCLYRISDNGYANKQKLPHATKKKCLLNFLVQFPTEEVIVFQDRCIEDTASFLRDYETIASLQVNRIDEGSSAQSFRHVYEYAINSFNDDDVVYFVEDDYFHVDHSRQILLEGIERADYVSGYDCVDKYIPANMGGNPLIGEDGGEETKVYLTASSHWKLTNSTTLTFMSTVKTLKEDYDIWKDFCFTTPAQSYPHDFQCFLALRDKGRSLITPLPAISTHTETAWLSPLVDWSEENL